MASVLEALQEAEKRNRGLKEAIREIHKPSGPALAERPKPEAEDQMTGLFYIIESLLPSPGAKTIQFIGSELGDGASTVACVFAQTVAHRLDKVLLLFSSDVAFADSHRFLHHKSVQRFDDIMQVMRSPDKNQLSKDDGSSLYVSIFSSKRRIDETGQEQGEASDLWDALKERFDMILIDSPPVDLHPDGLVISRKVDGTIIVVRAEKTRWPDALRVKEKLERQGANILGTVFNDQRRYLPKWLSAHLRA